MVKRKYLHPWFSERVHETLGLGQEKLEINGHATKLPKSWPNAHQMERTVKSHWWEAGMTLQIRGVVQE